MPNTPDESPVVHVVDDDADLGDGLSCVLRSVGLNPKAYSSTQEFLQAAQLGGAGVGRRVAGVDGGAGVQEHDQDA
jgi:FixJ family two-component response regulator